VFVSQGLKASQGMHPTYYQSSNLVPQKKENEKYYRSLYVATGQQQP